GKIANDPELLAMALGAFREGAAVAQARGVAIPAQLVDGAAATLAALPPETKSSMLEDLERGRRLELPWLSGAVVPLGRELGVEAPTHRFIAAVLGPHVGGRA